MRREVREREKNNNNNNKEEEREREAVLSPATHPLAVFLCHLFTPFPHDLNARKKLNDVVKIGKTVKNTHTTKQ